MSAETFSIEIQQKLLSLLVQDRMFLSHMSNLMHPYYFDSEILVDISKVTLDYFKEYRTNPTPLSLAQEVAKHVKKQKRKNPGEYIDLIDDLFSDALPERDFLIKEAKTFITFQELRNALASSVDLLEEHKFDDIKKKIDKAYSSCILTSEPLRFFDREKIEKRYDEKEVRYVSTGFPEMDSVIGGGLGAGELGIILAPPNVGKSILLMLFGANALRQGKKVLHISLEMGEEKIALRYDRNLVGKTKSLIKDGLDEFADFIEQMHRKIKCNLYIKRFPTRGLSVNELRAYINSLRIEDFVPDLILVDYGQIMKANVTRGNRHEEIEEINEDLRGLLGELDIPGWSAAQTNKYAVSKKIITIEDFGECFGQSKVADVIPAICQTPEEYKNNELRLFWAKVRDDKKHQVLEYKTAFDVMRMKYTHKQS